MFELFSYQYMFSIAIYVFISIYIVMFTALFVVIAREFVKYNELGFKVFIRLAKNFKSSRAFHVSIFLLIFNSFSLGGVVYMATNSPISDPIIDVITVDAEDIKEYINDNVMNLTMQSSKFIEIQNLINSYNENSKFQHDEVMNKIASNDDYKEITPDVESTFSVSLVSVTATILMLFSAVGLYKWFFSPKKSELSNSGKVATVVTLTFSISLSITFINELNFFSDTTIFKVVYSKTNPITKSVISPVISVQPPGPVITAEDHTQIKFDCGQGDSYTIGTFPKGEHELNKKIKTTLHSISENKFNNPDHVMVEIRSKYKDRRVLAIALIGSVDRQKLSPAAQRLYGTNENLSLKRAIWVKGEMLRWINKEITKSTSSIPLGVVMPLYVGPSIKGLVDDENIKDDRVVYACVVYIDR